MLFSPQKIGSLELKNRIIRSGCFEGMCPNGIPSENLFNHHVEMAKGGIAMTTVAYCSVSKQGRAYGHEMWMRKEIIPDLKKLTDAVHSYNAKASVQLGHCGFFASKRVIGETPIGPSRKFCNFRFGFSRPMNRTDFENVKRDFENSARMSIESGFDAIELHAGHGYLLSQFLSPWINVRKDEYGGRLENRLRFPLEVIKAVREAVGKGFPILVKMNLTDGFKGGLTIDESVEVAKAFEAAGVDAIVPSCGFTAKTPFYMLRGDLPIKEFVRNEKNPFLKLGTLLFGRMMVPKHKYEEMFLFEDAKKIREAVKIPVILIGGILSKENMEKALNAGFDFVQIGRATVMDSDIVNKIQAGSMIKSDCDHCNRCVGEMDGPGGVRCVTKDEKIMKDY